MFEFFRCKKAPFWWPELLFEDRQIVSFLHKAKFILKIIAVLKIKEEQICTIKSFTDTNETSWEFLVSLRDHMKIETN